MLMICISEQRLFSLYPIPDIYPTISGRKTGFEPTEPTTEQHGKKEDFYIPILFADTSGNDHRMERYQKVLPSGRKNDPYLYRNNLETGRPLDMLRTAVKVTGSAMVASMADK